MNNPFYVTTTIPYVNARPHVGFALELVQADAIARCHRRRGRAVRFQTGTDENAFKNVLTARREGVSTTEFVDRNTAAFRELVGALNTSPDSFVRTTDDRHRSGVHALWRQLRPGDLYQKSYRGLYCTGCEDFWLERDLVNGCCPDHEAPPIEVEEQNWFFRLSAYQARIEDGLASGRVRVVPEKRRNEVLAFVRRGLDDISVSRLAARSGGWGIPVPGDPAQVIYVWIDALINYLSGLGYGAGEGWRETWNEGTRKVHVIGKLGLLWATVTRLNQEIDRARPWDLLKAAAREPLRGHLARCLAELDTFAYWFEPFLPSTAARIRGVFAADPIRRCEPLFPRLA